MSTFITRSLTLEEETKEPVETTITGEVPPWLKGSLYRNGSGVFEVGDIKVNHLFDGFAVLCRYDIENGRVFFKNRILRSENWNESIKANRLVYDQFGTKHVPDPCKNIFSRYLAYFKTEISDNMNVNIVKHGDAIFTLTEGSKIFQVDPDSLDPIDTVNFEKLLSVHLATAHPHFDHDGVLYNLATNFMDKNMAHCIISSKPTDVKDAKPFDNAYIVGSVPSRWKMYYSYIHSFGLSENHFVILEQNFCINLLKAAVHKIVGYHMSECCSIFDNEETQFSVLKKKDGAQLPTVYRSENFFSFHHINSFEQDGFLVVDMCGHKDKQLMDQTYIDNLRKGINIQNKAVFMRFVLPLDIDDKTPFGQNLVTLENCKATAVKRKDGTVFLTCDYLTDDSDASSGFQCEFPIINYAKHNGRPYRYVYGSYLTDTVNKVDTVGRTCLTYKDPGGNSVGESVFVPHPDAEAEDQGVLLIPVINKDPNSPCYLTILDSETMKPIVKCDVPTSTVIPMSFHGFFNPKN